ncbi:MAG: PIN domain-containing protein [Planctomycetes bacterium]|nr:PIN domain-containing protein [Planctomycetota bacterium]
MSVDAFDTNVLVYACNKSDAQKRQIAQQILESKDGVILWQTACEFISATRKLADQGFAATDAWRHLDFLLESMPLVVPNRMVLDEAQRLHLKLNLSYWDALIIAACLDAGVTRLYSEDLPGRAPPEGLEIINPFA